MSMTAHGRVRSAPRQTAKEGLQDSALTDILLPRILGIIMLGMGLGPRLKHSLLLRAQPPAVVAGVRGRRVVLPIAGTMVAYGWSSVRPRQARGKAMGT